MAIKKQPVMESYDHDILLLREMIASELFQFKKGSPDRDKFWESTQRRLNRLDKTLNSAKNSVSLMSSRSNLACELCGKSGFLERQLFHKTKNSSSEIILPSYASNSISLGSRKDIFHRGFRKLSRQFSKGLPSQKHLFA